MKSLVALLVAVAVVAAPSAATATESRGSKCQADGTKTLEASKSVRVFYRGSIAANRKYACFVKTGRVTSLGRWDADLDAAGTANLVALSGSFVAYHKLVCAGREGDCARSEVRVLNVRTGEVTRSRRAGAGGAGIAGLVVRSTGQAAYLREYADGSRQLHLLTSVDDRIIDTGTDIEPFSLTFAGRILYWTRGGEARSLRV